METENKFEESGAGALISDMVDSDNFIYNEDEIVNELSELEMLEAKSVIQVIETALKKHIADFFVPHLQALYLPQWLRRYFMVTLFVRMNTVFKKNISRDAREMCMETYRNISPETVDKLDELLVGEQYQSYVNVLADIFERMHGVSVYKYVVKSGTRRKFISL